MSESDNHFDDYGWLCFGAFADKLLSFVKISSHFAVIKSDFISLNTNKDRIHYCVNDIFISNSISKLYEELVTNAKNGSKSLSEAKKMRQNGNNCFKEKLYEESVNLYSSAICLSPFVSDSNCENNDELSLSLANRSAALYHMKQYESCLLDIEDAIKYGYPHHLKHKLIIRKAQCLASLGRPENAKLVLTDFLHALDNDNNAKNDSKIKDDIQELLTQIELNDSNDQKCLSNTDTSILSQNILNDNNLMTNASDNIELSYSPNKGRHIIASNAIKFGEILLAEKPFATYLNWDKFDQHCQHCLIQLNGRSIPCLNCVDVRFCSDSCRQNASCYHRFECNSILNVLKEIGISYIVYRILFKVGINNAVVISNKFDKQTHNQKGLNEIFSDDYSSILSLLDHESDHNFESMLSYTLAAHFLLFILEKNSFVNCEDNDFRLSLGALILKHIQQLSTNLISILKQNISDELNKFGLDAKEEIIGTALFPTASLFNHSCSPNVFQQFINGSKIIFRVSKSISKGEEVNYCYGPNYHGMSRADRQRKLKEQYYFECECDACFNNKQNLTRALLCGRCNGAVVYNIDYSSECLNCHSIDLDVHQVMKQINEGEKYASNGLDFLEQENYSEALINLHKANQILSENLYRNHQSLCKIKDNLCRCYALMGHFDRAIKYCEQSIQITSAIFGDESIEVLTEIIKLISLKWNVVDETTDKVQKSNFATDLIEIIKRADNIIAKYSSTDGFVNAFQAEIEYLNEKKTAVQKFIS